MTSAFESLWRFLMSVFLAAERPPLSHPATGRRRHQRVGGKANPSVRCQEFPAVRADVLRGGFPLEKEATEPGEPGRAPKMATLVLDNGAYNAKIGYSHAHVR